MGAGVYMRGGGRGVCGEGVKNVCPLGPSVFNNAHTCILTLIIWVQLCHTQCMLVNKLLGKEKATIISILSLEVKTKINKYY